MGRYYHATTTALRVGENAGAKGRDYSEDTERRKLEYLSHVATDVPGNFIICYADRVLATHRPEFLRTTAGSPDFLH